MTPIQFEHLDIPIIRSCNLACKGCITHSDHKNIRGTVRIEDSHDWLSFWSTKLDPKTITLFGGEPLLHPQFAAWVKTVRQYWPKNSISLNTNGYYLPNLFDNIADVFGPGTEMSMVISIQTGTEPYLSKVRENIALLKQQVLDYYLTLPGVKSAEWNLWLDESATHHKQWFGLKVNGVTSAIGFAVCEQYKLPWCIHYTGFGEEMRPTYDYNANHEVENHQYCQAKKFVTLYRGRIYKCPPIGVLEHSLLTFGIKDHPEWQPYMQQYRTLGVTSTDQEIQQWFVDQANPEKVCNMCGFSGPKSTVITPESRSHVLKNYWNYSL